MRKTNHTPGPWKAVATYAQPEVRGADSSLVAVLPVGELKDARLIAAAPLLLDALQRLLNGEKDEFLTPAGLRNLARAAIAAATN